MTASPPETHLAAMTKEVVPANLSINLTSRAHLHRDAELGQISGREVK